MLLANEGGSGILFLVDARRLIVMSLYGRCIFGLLLGASLLSWFSESASAQQAAAPPAPASNSRPIGPNVAVEGTVVALLMAGAGFAVGRPSGRS